MFWQESRCSISWRKESDNKKQLDGLAVRPVQFQPNALHPILCELTPNEWQTENNTRVGTSIKQVSKTIGLLDVDVTFFPALAVNKSICLTR